MASLPVANVNARTEALFHIEEARACVRAMVDHKPRRCLIEHIRRLLKSAAWLLESVKVEPGDVAYRGEG
jgi:hypothetical protein